MATDEPEPYDEELAKVAHRKGDDRTQSRDWENRIDLQDVLERQVQTETIVGNLIDSTESMKGDIRETKRDMADIKNSITSLITRLDAEKPFEDHIKKQVGKKQEHNTGEINILRTMIPENHIKEHVELKEAINKMPTWANITVALTLVAAIIAALAGIASLIDVI